MRRRKCKPGLRDAVPFAAFLGLFLFFTLASYDGRTGTFRMLTARNLSALLEQTMQTVLAAGGVLFVAAQGGTDLSAGVNLALSGVVGVWAAHAAGAPFLMIPAALLTGLLAGLFNGFAVSRCRVPSFMQTLAMLIGVRGLVNYIQTKTGVQSLPAALSFLSSPAVKAALFLAAAAALAYVFEFTRTGRWSRAIGENETAARFVGVPVDRVKTAAFALSGLMAGVGAVFSVACVGSTSQQMGAFLEIRAVAAVFLGGVPASGGFSARFYKVLLGSFSIQIIVNGLALMGRSDPQTAQSAQGVLLLLILLLSAAAGKREPGGSP